MKPTRTSALTASMASISFDRNTKSERPSESKGPRFIALVGLLAFGLLIIDVPPQQSKPITAKAREHRAQLSEQISVRGARRGSPLVNLSDGRDVLTGYTGAGQLEQALE